MTARLGLISLTALLSAGVAQAQTPTGPDPQPPTDTVVVTATKRATELQTSDVSATVIDAKTIDQARLRDVRRIDDLVPNVQFNEKSQLGGIFVTIRGVESNPFIVNRAAVYIDGIPFRELSNAVLTQLESIEVLRGPQATLYGANSESGLIVVTTKSPSEGPESSLRLTGTNFASGYGYQADGFVSGPLTETLSGSLSFAVSKEDAFARTLASSIGEEGEMRDGYVQGRLQWQPTDRLTLSAMAYHLHTVAPGMFSYEYLPLDVVLYNETYGQTFNGGRLLKDFTSLNDAPKRHDEEEYVVGLSAVYELDAGQIDAAASFRREDADSRGLDFDFTAAPIVAGAEKDTAEVGNAEIRFTSNDISGFDYIIGAAVYDETASDSKGTFLGSGDLDAYNYAPKQFDKGRDYSVFGTVRYAPAFAPGLRLSAGLRYDRAKRSTQQTAGVLDLGFGSVITYQDANLSTDFEAVLPRLGFNYEANDALAFYGSTAQGWIPGGFNLAAVQQGYTDQDVLRYDKETVWSSELGVRWRSPGRNLRMSAAIFQISSDNWQDIQVATDNTGRPVSSDFIGSDASIESKGFEIEMQWDPDDALSLTANLGYVDATYNDLQVDSTTNLRGKQVQFVPEYDALLAARYQWPNGIYLRGEANFTGGMALEARGRAIQPAVVMYGVQLGWENESYAVRLFGENLTNERRMSGLAVQNLAFGTDGNFYGPLDAPRILGVEFEWRN